MKSEEKIELFTIQDCYELGDRIVLLPMLEPIMNFEDRFSETILIIKPDASKFEVMAHFNPSLFSGRGTNSKCYILIMISEMHKENFPKGSKLFVSQKTFEKYKDRVIQNRI